MHDQRLSRGKFCRKCIQLQGKAYHLSMRGNPKSNCAADDEVTIFLTRVRALKKTVDAYCKCWRIECLFCHLRSNGFGLNALNLQPPAKSNLMMILVCLAYAITIRAGWQSRSTIRRIQSTAQGCFAAEPVFRRSLSLVTARLRSLPHFTRYLLTLDSEQNHLIIDNV